MLLQDLESQVITKLDPHEASTDYRRVPHRSNTLLDDCRLHGNTNVIALRADITNSHDNFSAQSVVNDAPVIASVSSGVKFAGNSQEKVGYTGVEISSFPGKGGQ